MASWLVGLLSGRNIGIDFIPQIAIVDSRMLAEIGWLGCP